MSWALSGFVVSVDEWRLIVVWCGGGGAAKYEELEDGVPTLEELNECCNRAYSSDMIKEMEVQVLGALNWHLGVITPFHFLSFYLHEGMCCAVLLHAVRCGAVLCGAVQ